MSRYLGSELRDLPTPPGCIDADDCHATTCKCLPARAYEFTSLERDILSAHGHVGPMPHAQSGDEWPSSWSVR